MLPVSFSSLCLCCVHFAQAQGSRPYISSTGGGRGLLVPGRKETSRAVRSSLSPVPTLQSRRFFLLLIKLFLNSVMALPVPVPSPASRSCLCILLPATARSLTAGPWREWLVNANRRPLAVTLRGHMRVAQAPGPAWKRPPSTFR